MNRRLAQLGCALTGTLMVSASGSAMGLEQTQLVVEIRGLNQPQGQVCLNLFDGSAGFPSDREQALATQCLPTTASAPLLATFADLSPGSYAVSAFHDANSDSEFNRNFVGMPEEGFGFSRNPDALTGPPEFGDAVVLVAGTETRIEIDLSYF